MFRGASGMAGRSIFNWSLPVALAAGVVCLAFGGGAAKADPSVTNGSFETPVVSNYLYQPSGSGWNFISSSGIASAIGSATPGAWFSNLVAPGGNQVGFIQDSNGSAGAISQSISGFTVGQLYWVKFYAAARPGYTGANINVDVNNSLVQTVAAPSTSSFVQYTVTFAATAATEVLSFVSGTNNNPTGDYNTALDLVTVTLDPPVSTIEPASIATLGMGVFGLAALRRRKVGPSASELPRVA
jgi:hypothetical protein